MRGAFVAQFLAMAAVCGIHAPLPVAARPPTPPPKPNNADFERMQKAQEKRDWRAAKRAANANKSKTGVKA